MNIRLCLLFYADKKISADNKHFSTTAQFELSIKAANGASRFQDDPNMFYSPGKKPPPYEFLSAYRLGAVISYQPTNKYIRFDYGLIAKAVGTLLYDRFIVAQSQTWFWTLYKKRYYYLNMPVSAHFKVYKPLWLQLTFSNNILLYDPDAEFSRNVGMPIFANYEAAVGVGINLQLERWKIGVEAQRSTTNLWPKEIFYKRVYFQSIWLTAEYKLLSF